MNIFKRFKELEDLVSLLSCQIDDIYEQLEKKPIEVKESKKDEQRIFINRVPDWQKKYAEEQMRVKKGE